MNYSGIQGRLTAVLGELSDIREIVRDAQRAAIGTHRTRMTDDLEVVGDELGIAHEWITRTLRYLILAGQVDGGDDE